MEIVTNYSVEYKNSSSFDVTFEIPNNCAYTQSVVLKIYYITVQLQPGQLTPSSTFISNKVTLATIDGILSVNFVQICEGKTATRPKIKVENS